MNGLVGRAAKAKSADTIAGGLFLLVGVGAVIGAVGLQIGTPSEPQPGFFPFMAGLGLMILSGLLVVQSIRGRTSGAEPFVQLRKPIQAMLGLAGFAIVLEPLGYVLATAALSTVLLLVLDVKKGWGYAFIILLSVGSYLLFDRLLDVPLPEGILGTMLGI
jgi:putative tricarboxylic transport membrane protein